MVRTFPRLLIVFALIGIAFFAASMPVHADGGPGGVGTPGSDPAEPIEIIDAAFTDLSNQLGKALGPENTVYRWKDDLFLNTDLNCRTPGKVLPREMTRGFSIWIRLIVAGRYQAFIYRSTRNGAVLFQCLPTGPGPLIKVPGAPFPEDMYKIRIQSQLDGTDTTTTSP